MNRPPRSPRFAQTRALVRIALADGYTQSEIARRSRTTQSVVSGWANGKSLATEQQVAWLREQYGYRLDRTQAGVYRVVQPRACDWEDSPEAQTLARLTTLQDAAQQARRGSTDKDPGPRGRLEALLQDHSNIHSNIGAAWTEVLGISITDHFARHEGTLPLVEQALREDYAHACSKVVRIEGSIVFRHTFEVPAAEPRRNAFGNTVQSLRWRPQCRWMVHRAGRRHFRLVRQRVAELVGLRRVAWYQQAIAALGSQDDPWHLGDRGRGCTIGSSSEAQLPALPTAAVHSRDDAGRWVATIEGPLLLPALLDLADRIVAEEGGPHDQETVPFLLRRALLNHGYDVPDIERLGPVTT